MQCRRLCCPVPPHRSQALKLAQTGAFASERVPERAVQPEHLHVVRLAVRHRDRPIAPHRHVRDAPKVIRLRPAQGKVLRERRALRPRPVARGRRRRIVAAPGKEGDGQNGEEGGESGGSA